MIQITSLYKVYRSRKNRKCYALNDINLTLPDAGLVFVLGKSGSGKSTLLNLIGGLDKITSGKIEVDGNDISHLNERKMCNYRNSHVGFIFQDYHLIEELTVYDNILLSLNLRRMKDYGDVSAALEKVGLAGYENRYPSELSGGERQRVAIARAIIKNPRIILADEPTGNLDYQTATSIIELLREISQEHLILVVSHNKRDALTYADRIIELAKGSIIDDYTRKSGSVGGVQLSGGVLVYPEGRELSDDDISLINQNASRQLVKSKSQFIDTIESDEEPSFVEILKEKLSFFRKIRLSNKFLKRKSFVIALSSFMVATIMIIMSLAQTIIAFDSGEVISNELIKNNQEALLLIKSLSEERQQEFSRPYNVEVGEGDINAFYEAGYKGDIYPVLSYTLPIRTRAVCWGLGSSFYSSKSIYISETFGTMIVDEAFLAEKFGSEITYAAKVDEFKPYGVIITDYTADAILTSYKKYKGYTYEDLLGNYYYQTTQYLPHCYINGIIDTGYKDRYSDFIKQFQGKSNLNLTALYELDEFKALFAEIYNYLGYSYTTNPDFVEAVQNAWLVFHTPHYLLSFNGTIDLPASGTSLVYPQAFYSTIQEFESSLYSNFLYTQTPPTIPEGAKYIRVSFNDRIDDVYNVGHEVAKMECALLRFDDDEPISKELMNFQQNEKEAKEGIGLDPHDGSIVNTKGRGKNAGWVSDYIEIPEGATITEFASIAVRQYAYYAFYDENKNCITTGLAFGDEVPEDCIIMSYTKYNEVFGTSYNETDYDTFVPHKVMLAQYGYDDQEKTSPLFQKEVTILALHTATSSGGTIYASNNVYELFKKDAIREIALYMNGAKGIGNTMDVMDDLNYTPQSFTLEGIHTMTKAVDVFVPIFELIAIVLCIGVVFILINFSSRMIKDKMHEIGILKALGTQNGTVATVFGLQVVLIAIFTCVLSTIGYYYFIDLANDVLIESLKRLTERVVLDLDFLTFQKDIARDNCILVFILALVALIAPMLKIKVIKPVKIIKTKD